MGETPGWVDPSLPPPPPSAYPIPAAPPASGQWGSLPPPPPQWGGPPPGQYIPPGQYAPPGQYLGAYPGAPQQPWGWAPPPADFKPGIVALRPLSVGEILDGGFATIRLHPRIAFGFAALFAAVLELARLLTGVAMRNVSGSLGSFYSPTHTDAFGRQHVAINGAGAASTIVEYVLGGVFQVLLAGIVTVVVGKAVLGRPITGSEVVAAVRARPWRLLAVGLIAGLGPFAPALVVGLLAAAAYAVGGGAALAVALVIGIPAGCAAAVLLWGKLALVVPAFMLEKLGARASVSRSWRLVRGAFWRVWGLRALVSLIVGVAGGVIGAIFVAISAGLGSFSAIAHDQQQPLGALMVTAIGSAVVWALTQPLLASALTLIYVDRRMRAEGLDIQLTHAAQAAAPAPAGRF